MKHFHFFARSWPAPSNSEYRQVNPIHIILAFIRRFTQSLVLFSLGFTFLHYIEIVAVSATSGLDCRQPANYWDGLEKARQWVDYKKVAEGTQILKLDVI